MDFAEFDIKYRIIDTLTLPPYKGSTIRGAFGNIFRKVVCPFKNKECNECLVSTKCVYTYVFETPVPEGAKIMRKYEHAPHPFIIEPPLDNKTVYERDEALTFELILISKAIDYLPYFIYAFEMIGEKGIGRERKKIKLTSIAQKKGLLYDADTKLLKQKVISQKIDFSVPKQKIKTIKIEFQTPTRIVYQGIILRNPEFYKIIPNLLRRLFLISYFHCDSLLDINFNALLEKAKAIKTNLEYFEYKQLERFSSRQNKKIPMDGFVGTVIYEGDLTPFYPYLKAGEVLHIGKGTAFGMGKYRMLAL
ncbi:MAG: CRISPR system precrRNA processing endoribonuclease RAMP protein Cas6 [candidate division WOR-3 bacterium]